MLVKICDLCRYPIKDNDAHYVFEQSNKVHLHIDCAKNAPFEDVAEIIGLFPAVTIPVTRKPERIHTDLA